MGSKGTGNLNNKKAIKVKKSNIHSVKINKTNIAKRKLSNKKTKKQIKEMKVIEVKKALRNMEDYNTAGSKSPKNVQRLFRLIDENHAWFASRGVPNSVYQSFKNGKLEKERYMNEKGEVYLDIHYTNHGNSKRHPYVPHEHHPVVINGEIKHWNEGDIIKK